MGTIQDVVWGVSIVLMGALALVFLWVATGARAAIANYGPVIDSAYRLRVWLFGVALIVVGWTPSCAKQLPSRSGALVAALGRN